LREPAEIDEMQQSVMSTELTPELAAAYARKLIVIASVVNGIDRYRFPPGQFGVKYVIGHVAINERAIRIPILPPRP